MQMYVAWWHSVMSWRLLTWCFRNFRSRVFLFLLKWGASFTCIRTYIKQWRRGKNKKRNRYLNVSCFECDMLCSLCVILAHASKIIALFFTFSACYAEKVKNNVCSSQIFPFFTCWILLFIELHSHCFNLSWIPILKKACYVSLLLLSCDWTINVLGCCLIGKKNH